MLPLSCFAGSLLRSYARFFEPIGREEDVFLNQSGWGSDVWGGGATYEGGVTNEKKVTLSLFLVVEIEIDGPRENS